MKGTVSELVQFERLSTASEHCIGIATLRNGQRLNALDAGMISALYEQFKQWQADDQIACLFLCGENGRAFCAGGDVRELRRFANSGDTEFVCRYFEQEYRLDYLIHTFSKPVICWGEGIVMGGGYGLMAGADFRVVTSTSVIAMPEISIGLYPDVGASWFLNRLPNPVGLFIALTGCRLNAADALSLGLANRLVDSSNRQQLLMNLQAANWSGDLHSTAHRAMESVSVNGSAHLPPANVTHNRDSIDRMMDQPTLASVQQHMQAYTGENSWLRSSIQTGLEGSPLSAALVWEQLRRCRHVSLAEVFQREWTLSVNCVLSGDFSEGVRTRLEERGQMPQWLFDSVSSINSKHLDKLFAQPEISAQHPLTNL